MSVQYSVIIPAYHAENSIEQLYEKLKEFFNSNNYSFETIIVDDASTDGTWEKLNKLRTANKNVKIIRLAKNFGQHAATLCGVNFARGQYVITIDDDLEVHPQEIKHLIEEEKRTGNDVIYGMYRKLNRSFLRTIFTKLYRISSRTEGKNNGKGSSFRLIKSELALKLAKTHIHFTFIDELLLWYTGKMSFINVAPNKDYIAKKGGYSLPNLFRITGSIVMFSSTRPLRIVTNIGIALAVINFLVGTFYLLKKLFLKTPVHGYTSIIVSILFSTGLIVLSIGIVAQYISKILKDVNDKPSYYISEKSVDD
jgi:glycosyltransferase involved in cell wall biosynthesis